ncbi:uncharacterized protein LOC111212914 [Brassica napus]|uniref:uncharacterized protein LOC111212914 n=1 Tax=Brassica napus TaxID=3708 RepID=UPI00207AE668|nr:uncharacterized protein LOC111212914 [Brassica napus]
MAIKTDMSKAYDRVEWRFISQVLKRLGFHDKWITLIMQCVTTVSYSYLINDSAYGSVIPKRRIRQGDPLSSYLFILCGQVLSGLCQKGEREGTLQGVRVARNCPRVNHLLFADETMFFCQTSKSCYTKLKTILWEYEKASGQMINAAKSSITFSSKTPEEIKRNVKDHLGINNEGGSGKYLGLPEHFGRKKKDLFTSLVDRIRQRAQSLSTRRLSKAGKLTMLKAVLTAVPTYSMSCFELLVSLCKRIQSVLTRFWWDSPDGSRKMCWVAWETLTKPKAGGGLGLRDIQLFNQALLAKQAWRILTKPDSLLARILLGKYCHKKHFLDAMVPATCSHGWRSILHGRDLLKENLGKAIGNGQTTKLWKDSWISTKKHIKPYGPIPKEALDLTVSDLLTTEMTWNKRRIEELLPHVAMEIQLLQPSLSKTEDIYIWQPLPSGTYSTRSGYYVASMRKNDQRLPNQGPFDWIKDVWSAPCSPKMRIFIWSVIQRALPFGEQLQQRGIRDDALCHKCKGIESAMHTFFHCPFAQKAWNMIPLKHVVHLATGSSFRDAIVAFRQAICLPPTGVSNNILPWICWAIWTARNLAIFENRTLSPMEVAAKGIRLAREWNMAQDKDKATNNTLPRLHRTPRAPIVPAKLTIGKSDAAFDSRLYRAGFAWNFTDSAGSMINQGSRTQDFVGSPLIAEALALRSAILSAVNSEFKHLKMFSDNSTLVRAINNDTQVSEIFGIVKNIQQMTSAFVEISFSHLPRLQNIDADLLAKKTLRLSL